MPYFFVGHFRFWINGKKTCGFELIKPKKPAAIMKHPCSKITFFAVPLPAKLYHYYPDHGSLKMEKIKVILEGENVIKAIGGNGNTRKLKACVKKATNAQQALQKILF